MNESQGVWGVIEEFLDFINSIVRIFCIVAMACMTIIVIMQVFSRFTPGVKGLTWSEELSRYVMIYVAFIGASNGIRQWNNIGVDIVFNRLPSVLRFIVDVLIHLTILVFWCLVVYWGSIYFPKVGGRQYSASMGFPLLYAQLSVIIGGILSIVQTIGKTVALLMGGPKKDV